MNTGFSNRMKDVFTQNQIEKFNSICDVFDEKLNINPKRLILNTAGALRFTKAQNGY